MKVKLAHGGGGRETHALLEGLILRHLGNSFLDAMEDAAVLDLQGPVAFTTDAYVVKPLFFPGGDIGKLAVCGTANDLAVMGAVPSFLSLSLIIEEGLEQDMLERILKSIASESRTGNLQVVCGDTKVVERGSGDGLFINTSGIGQVRNGADLSVSHVEPGDVILTNGSVGEHGAAILGARHDIPIQPGIESDCAQLASLVQCILDTGCRVHAIRDATRGGLAAVANEMGLASGVTLVLQEKKIPVSRRVRAFCDLLGMNPFEMANEGKLVAAVPERDADAVLKAMKGHGQGGDAAVIGRVEEKGPFPAILETLLGVRTILDMPRGENLPRIC